MKIFFIDFFFFRINFKNKEKHMSIIRDDTPIHSFLNMDIFQCLPLCVLLPEKNIIYEFIVDFLN